MVHKDKNIDIVAKELVEDQPYLFSIFFHRPLDFAFEPGDWIDLAFPGQNLNGGKTYSISSSPTEPDIRISFREGESEFKRALQSVKPGDKLLITQYGNDYGFQLKKNQSSFLIAGGVGIAPFRSMLKEMVDQNDKNDVSLLYLNQNESFLFKDELDEWSRSLPNVRIDYISTKDINQKKRNSIIKSKIKNLNQNFYISGPPSMVEANEHLLIDMGVDVRDIRIDSFGGY